MPAKMNLTSSIFERLTVIKEDKNRKYCYWCRCACGTIKSIRSGSLRNGRSKSCGCLQKDLLHKRMIGAQERFWKKVSKDSDCWLWTAGQDGHGYGVFFSGHDDDHNIKAYKFSYELENGKVPTGFELDHICHNKDKSCQGGDACEHRLCVRPSHLEVVTKRINLMRGNGPSAINARKIQCNNGHEYTPENTYLNANTGKRRCIICRDIYRHAYYLKHKNLTLASPII